MSINQINDGDSGLTVRTILNEMVSFINSDVNYIGTGSFAKTGSNTFIGNQTITGSVNITGSLTVNTVNVGQNTLNFIDNSGNIVNSLSISGSNLVLSTGSVSTTSGGLTGSLFGTASWSNNSVSSSYALTASYYSNNILTLTPQNPLPSGSGVPTGSFAISASIPPRPYMWDGSSWYAL